MQIALFSLGLFCLSPILASPSSANLVGPVQPAVTDVARVEISGHYQPTTASVQVEFSGPNTAIAQQTRSQGLCDKSYSGCETDSSCWGA